MSRDRHVLVIDDDEHFARLLSVYLAKAGYRTTVAPDGVQGQRLARIEQPDLITIDYQMPAGSGVMVAERIKTNASTAHIPIIMLTGVPSPDLEAKAEAAGISAVLSKVTLTKDALLGALEEALAPGEPEESFDDLFPLHVD